MHKSVHSEAHLRQITAELVRLAYKQIPISFAITIVNATLLVFSLRQVIHIFSLLSWWTAMGMIALFRLGLLYSYQRAAPSAEAVQRWYYLFILGSVLAGCGWGAAGFFLFPAGALTYQLLLTFILGGMAIGAVASMAAIRPAYVGFVLPTTVPLILRFFFEGEELFVVMGVLSTIFIVGILAMAAQFHRAIRESLAFRFERQDLLHSQETLQQSNEELDRRVQERTAELTVANAALQMEITKHERTENELRESESRSRAMLQAIPDMMFRATRTGVFLDYKPREQFRTLAPPEFFIGKHLADIVPVGLAEEGKKAFAAVLQTGEVQALEYTLAVEGVERAYEARIAPNGSEEVVAIVRDITPQKEIERLKDELVSTVSHELRTPLTSVLGFVELLLTRNFSPEKQREYLLILQREAVRLTNLINDFLDLRRMESGQETYRFAPLSLAPLLQQSVDTFSGNAESHTFRLDLPATSPMGMVDADHLQRALINLLSNAVKFSPQGGEIVLGLRTQGDHLLLWVKDHGIGISPDVLPKVFDRFFRVDNRDTRNIGGTGLGLALVKEIVTAHNGKVWVESTVGQGSTFFFTLPIATNDHSQ